MKNTKKILAGILSVITMTGALSATAYAAEDKIVFIGDAAGTSIASFKDRPGLFVQSYVTYRISEEDALLWEDLVAQYAQYEEDLSAYAQAIAQIKERYSNDEISYNRYMELKDETDASFAEVLNAIRPEVASLNDQWNAVLFGKIAEELDKCIVYERDMREDFFSYDSYTTNANNYVCARLQPSRVKALTKNDNILSIEVDGFFNEGFSCAIVGDVNGDGEVNAADASVLLTYAAEIGNGTFNKTLDEYVKSKGYLYKDQVFGDVNEDDEINAADASVLLSYAAEIGNGSFTGTLDEYVVK